MEVHMKRKLTAIQAVELRQKIARGEKLASVASEYSVSDSTAWKIHAGQRYVRDDGKRKS